MTRDLGTIERLVRAGRHPVQICAMLRISPTMLRAALWQIAVARMPPIPGTLLDWKEHFEGNLGLPHKHSCTGL